MKEFRWVNCIYLLTHHRPLSGGCNFQQNVLVSQPNGRKVLAVCTILHQLKCHVTSIKIFIYFLYWWNRAIFGLFLEDAEEAMVIAVNPFPGINTSLTIVCCPFLDHRMITGQVERINLKAMLRQCVKVGLYGFDVTVVSNGMRMNWTLLLGAYGRGSTRDAQPQLCRAVSPFSHSRHSHKHYTKHKYIYPTTTSPSLIAL